MGQIAEDMADGSCCTECGQYFQHPKQNAILTHGYPVLCKECYDDYKEHGVQPDLERATADTFGSEPDDSDDDKEREADELWAAQPKEYDP